MSSIAKYISDSRVLNLKVKMTNGQVFNLDLAKELSISDYSLQDSLKNQPKAYAFINTLYKGKVVEIKKVEKQMEILEAKIIVNYSSSKSSDYFRKHNKLAAVNLAKYLARAHPLMVKKVKQYSVLIREKENLEVAVKAMEQRSELIRTLSANSRAERNNT